MRGCGGRPLLEPSSSSASSCGLTRPGASGDPGRSGAGIREIPGIVSSGQCFAVGGKRWVTMCCLHGSLFSWM
jgi:hypothetical protein